MLKKLFWSAILLFILFILAVFKVPEVAKSLADMAWYPNLPGKITEMKSTYDDVVTDIPSKAELEYQYNATISWALELKENITVWVQSTKDKVDSLRETMSWAEQTIDDLKWTYNDAKDFIDETWKKINETKKIIEDTQAVIDKVKNTTNNNNTGSTNN